MTFLDPILSAARKGKLDYWVQLFSSDVDAAAARFIAEMLWGITFAGSIRLSRIADSLEEGIPERATIKRLSRNLARPGLDSILGSKVLSLASERIRDDTFLILHRHSLLKKHAKDMEFLDDILDPNGSTMGKGYQLCDIIGWNPEADEVTALAQTLWSENEPGYVGDSEWRLIGRTRKAMPGRGIIVSMWPFQNRRLLTRLVQEDASRFLFHLLPTDPVLYNRKKTSAVDIADQCQTPYGDTVFADQESRESDVFVHYGFLPVRLPERPDRPLWMVVVRGFDKLAPGKDPLPLLTTEPMRRNRRVLWRMVEGYFSSMGIQSTNSLLKQRCDFEDVRVRSYTRLRNIAALVLAASYFSTAFGNFSLGYFPVRFRRRNSEAV